MAKITNNYFIQKWEAFSSRPVIHKILIGFYATLGGVILATMLAFGTKVWAIYQMPDRFNALAKQVDYHSLRFMRQQIDSAANYQKFDNMANEVHEIHKYMFPDNNK